MSSGVAISRDLRKLPALGIAGYLVSLALLGPFLTPQIGIWDTAVTVGSLGWRFGFLGLVYSSAFYLILALLAAGTTAAILGHRRLLYLVAVLSLVAALLFAAGLPLFALDTLQIRRSMPSDAFAQYKSAALKGAALASLSFVTLIVMSRATFLTLRGLPAPKGTKIEPGRGS